MSALQVLLSEGGEADSGDMDAADKQEEVRAPGSVVMHSQAHLRQTSAIESQQCINCIECDAATPIS